MYQLRLTSQFKKDLKLARKRNLDLKLLDTIVTQLVTEGNISSSYKPHKLTGNYQGFWECHIQSDWLLIWEQNEQIELISLIRTGTHSDLF